MSVSLERLAPLFRWSLIGTLQLFESRPLTYKKWADLSLFPANAHSLMKDLMPSRMRVPGQIKKLWKSKQGVLWTSTFHHHALQQNMSWCQSLRILQEASAGRAPDLAGVTRPRILVANWNLVHYPLTEHLQKINKQGKMESDMWWFRDCGGKFQGWGVNILEKTGPGQNCLDKKSIWSLEEVVLTNKGRKPGAKGGIDTIAKVANAIPGTVNLDQWGKYEPKEAFCKCTWYDKIQGRFWYYQRWSIR